ncbi:hypothetical protein VPH35_125059 [Triticum aestivum]
MNRSHTVGRRDYVLLSTCGHSELADDNSTTAYTFTEATKTIKVTVADLPSLFYFHVSCPDLQDDPFSKRPEILWSSEDLVLFRVDLAGPHPRRREFFIYRAGCEPSLDLLPDVSAYFFKEGLNLALAGVIPDDDDDDDDDSRGFVLAVFKRDWRSGQCKLHVFRSKRRAWTIEHLDPDLPCWITKCSPGILLCKMLEEPMTAHFIALPNPLPGNRRHYDGGSSGRSIRDVACTDDGSTITCVEMEDLHRIIRSVGWRLMTWHRELSSDYWRKGCILHDGDRTWNSLLASSSWYNPAIAAQAPETIIVDVFCNSLCSGPDKLPLNHMFTCCPILCGDGVVCLLSRRGDYLDKDAWIVTVFNPAYISCVLKKYLKSESDGGGSLDVEDTRSHGKRRQPSLENTSCDTSRLKRALRGSTMEQRKRYG